VPERCIGCGSYPTCREHAVAVHDGLEIPELRDKVGFDIETAEDGKTALEALTRFQPDLLLLDYKLPDLSGLDILREIHDRALDALTIMVTAYATLETAIVATRQGAFDFLAKPCNPGELRAVVSKAARHLVLGRQARRLEEEKREVRFQFISVLAHELKAPFAAVEVNLYLLRDPDLNTPWAVTPTTSSTTTPSSPSSKGPRPMTRPWRPSCGVASRSNPSDRRRRRFSCVPRIPPRRAGSWRRRGPCATASR
jgi:CheY-like chemotaxis protein